MKTDIVRSLTSRCELLCEDIDVVEGDTSMKHLFCARWMGDGVGHVWYCVCRTLFFRFFAANLSTD